MRAAYTVFAIMLFACSAALGLFFVGSAGLAASSGAMSFAWAAWGLGCCAAVAGTYVAVRRISIALLVAFSVAPFVLALVVSKLALSFGQ
jgi:hypothetical protein